MDAKELKAGGELDALIAEKVMGWPKADFYEPEFHPSTDISDAWEVVEKLHSEKRFMTIDNCQVFEEGPMKWCCSISEKDSIAVTAYHIEADTAPLAICLAALKAVGYE